MLWTVWNEYNDVELWKYSDSDQLFWFVTTRQKATKRIAAFLPR